LKEITYGVKDTGEQYYTLENNGGDRKDLIHYKDLILKELQEKGVFLTFVGIKINSVGSNNPLLMPRGCVTPTYRFLYNMNKATFKFEGEDDYTFFMDSDLILNLEFERETLKVCDLRSKLKEEGIEMFIDLDDNTVLLHGNNTNVELEILFKVVNNNFSIEKLKYEMNLDKYYLPINSKSITQRTVFNQDKFYFEVYPRLENFNKIMKEFLSLNKQ